MKLGDMLLLLRTHDTVWVSKSGVSNLISFNGPQTDHGSQPFPFSLFYHYRPINKPNSGDKRCIDYIKHQSVYFILSLCQFDHKSSPENRNFII